jgi:hypothetical protein
LISAGARSGQALSSETSKEHLRKCSYLRKSIFENAQLKQSFEKASSIMLNDSKVLKKASSKMLNSSKACTSGASWICKFIEIHLVLQAFPETHTWLSWVRPEASREHIGSSCECLGESWSVLAVSWRRLGPSCERLGPSRLRLGASWEPLGASWEHLGASWTVSGAISGASRISNMMRNPLVLQAF